MCMYNIYILVYNQQKWNGDMFLCSVRSNGFIMGVLVWKSNRKENGIVVIAAGCKSDEKANKPMSCLFVGIIGSNWSSITS